jgi:two-component system sporulation sensor kinase B
MKHARIDDMAGRRWHFNARIIGIAAALAGFTLVLIDDLIPRYQQGQSLFPETAEFIEFLVLCPGVGILAFLSAQYLFQREFDMQQKLQRMEAQRFVVLGRIAGSIAHEVRNPLHNMKLVLEELRLQIGDDQRYMIRHLDDNIERIDMVVKLIYELASPGYHLEDDLVNNINLNDLIDGLLDTFRSNSSVPVVVSGFEKQICVVGNVSGLEIAFENVLRNAQQACEQSPETDGIHISSRIERQMCILEIVNRARLPDELLLPDAESFTSKRQGLGLGLFIARHLLERMQGSLLIEQRGEEAVVSFKLQLGVRYEV